MFTKRFVSKRRQVLFCNDKDTISSPNATYVIEGKLGSGGVGDVYKATETKADGATQTVAIKVMDLSRMKKGGKDLFSIECDAMKAARGLDHPNIIKILDSWSCEENQTAYIVMEYLDGQNLGELIASICRLKEDRARKIFVELVDAVEHCHRRGVRHRDLKPGNILVERGGDNHIKVLDFGFASIFEEGEKASPKLHSPVGTQRFMAPEVCNERIETIGYSGAAADVYSCGVTLLMMLTGVPDGYKPINKFARNPSTLGISPAAHHLLNSMIAPHHTRATMREVKNHPWLQGKSSI